MSFTAIIATIYTLLIANRYNGTFHLSIRSKIFICIRANPAVSMYRIFHGTLYVLVSSMCPLKCKYCVLPFSLCHIYIFICILRLLYSQASVEFCCSKIGMSKRLRQKNIRSTHFPWGFFGGINYVQSHYCFLANGIVTPNVDVVKERKTIQRPSVSCGRTNGGKTPNTSEMSKRAESGRRWKWYTGMRFVFRKILNYI